MTRLLVGPFNRVEGDLEVSLEIENGRVKDAFVNSTMYRGFEQILHHKNPLDSLVYVPRICGICSVSQSVAASRALADAMQLQAPANGIIATNLLLATENMADHLSHFYLFFMPDFARSEYRQHHWHNTVSQRFEAQQGEHARHAISARQRWLTIMGTLGGKWPHTHSIQPGGSSRGIEAIEKIRLLGRIREFRFFLEKYLFADSLERIAALQSEHELWTWHAQKTAELGDLRLFLNIAKELELEHLGQGPGLYLSYGAYPDAQSVFHFARGTWQHDTGEIAPIDVASITEDATYAWLSDQGGPRHPTAGITQPNADKPNAYTWNKAPRLSGKVLETGAIARQLVNAHPLIRDAAARCGGNVYTRVLARLLELALIVPLMEDWLAQLQMNEPYCVNGELPHDADGVGLNEAARGSLGHWISIRGGKIANYQIIAPTTWNFSPRDQSGLRGALEAALVGTAVSPGDDAPVAVQHIVRSFDPCMVCTVH